MKIKKMNKNHTNNNNNNISKSIKEKNLLNLENHPFHSKRIHPLKRLDLKVVLVIKNQVKIKMD